MINAYASRGIIKNAGDISVESLLILCNGLLDRLHNWVDIGMYEGPICNVAI
jgi:hypothetical protein